MNANHKKMLVVGAGLLLAAVAMAAPSTGSGSGSGSDNDTGTGPADVDYRGTSNPRGIRNNNPGNLRRTNINWQGKVPFAQSTDNAFEQFFAYKWGIRAMVKDLQNDFRVDGRKTIAALIAAYAPSSENDTSTYIQNVSSWTGIAPTAILPDTKGTWKALAIAMARKENGRADAITSGEFEQVWAEFF